MIAEVEKSKTVSFKSSRDSTESADVSEDVKGAVAVTRHSNLRMANVVIHALRRDEAKSGAHAEESQGSSPSDLKAKALASLRKVLVFQTCKPT